jgi:hypothetical protein
VNQIGKRRNSVTARRLKCQLIKAQVFTHLGQPPEAVHIVDGYSLAEDIGAVLEKQSAVIAQLITRHRNNVSNLEFRRHKISAFDGMSPRFFDF